MDTVTAIPNTRVHTGLLAVFADWRIWSHLGFRDMRVRYAHTIVGPWVSAIGVVLAGIASGLIMAQANSDNLREIVSVQLVKFSTWWLIAAAINDAVAVSETDRLILLNSTMPPGLLLMRLAFRNLVLAIHVQIALLVVFLLMGEWHVLARSILLGPIFFVTSAVLYGPMLILTYLGARSTTFIRLTPPLTQLLMFLSPVLWSTIAIGPLLVILKWNPVYWIIVGTSKWVMDGGVSGIDIAVIAVLLLLSFLLAELVLRYGNDMRLKMA